MRRGCCSEYGTEELEGRNKEERTGSRERQGIKGQEEVKCQWSEREKVSGSPDTDRGRE